MRFARRCFHAVLDADPRSVGISVAVGGVAAVWMLAGGVLSGFALAPVVGAVVAVVVPVGGVAVVGFAFLRWPAHAPISVAGERFERGFDDAAIGMMILTSRLRIVRVNAAICQLVAREPAQLVGRSILEFTHPDDVTRSVERRRPQAAEGDPPHR